MSLTSPLNGIHRFNQIAFLIGCVGVIGCTNCAFAQATRPSTAPSTQPDAPVGVDPKQTSEDPDYGYSKRFPIKVGSAEDFGGPKAERAYFLTLRDEAGKPLRFRRLGSLLGVGDEHILDGYELQTSTGRSITLYIDMYHADQDPQKQLAPKGLFKAK